MGILDAPPPNYPNSSGRATTTPRPFLVDVEDYMGAGSDTLAIRAAYADTPAGGTLRFRPRVYNLVPSGPFGFGLRITKRITLEGPGATIRPDATAATGCRAIQVNADDVTIEGLGFDGNGISQATSVYASTAARLVVRGCRFNNPASGALLVNDHITDSEFSGNIVTGHGYGVLVNDGIGNQRIMISRNIMRGLGDGNDADGIEINGVSNGQLEISCVGNIVSNYRGGNAATGFGIAYAHTMGGVITGNIVTDCSRNGIHIEAYSQDLQVTGNYVTRTDHGGIEVQGEFGITCQNINISGNTVTACAQAPSVNLGRGGIDIGSSTGAPFSGSGARTISVVGNQVSGCQGAGIYAFSVTESLFSGNMVRNTYGLSTDTEHLVHNAGMHFISCNRSLVTQNRIVDIQPTPTQYYPLAFYGSAVEVFTGMNLTHNNLGGVFTAGDLPTFLNDFSNASLIRGDAVSLGFFDATPVLKPTITGSRGDGSAVADLLASLQSLGLITDSSSA